MTRLEWVGNNIYFLFSWVGTRFFVVVICGGDIFTYV